MRANLKKHCESVHNEKVSDLIPCSICNKLIVTRRLNEHIKMVHCNEKPLSCQQCDKKFAKPSELKKHVIQEKDVLPVIFVMPALPTVTILQDIKSIMSGQRSLIVKFVTSLFYRELIW